MSARGMVQSILQINFAAPTALATDTVGTDALNATANSFTPVKPNVILDIFNETEPAAGLLYNLFTRRPNRVYNQLGNSKTFLNTLNLGGGYRAGLPKALGTGYFQFVEQQVSGALTAQNYVITLQQPLAL